MKKHRNNAKRPPWRYCVGMALAFIVGGYSGHALFLIWGRWRYGTDYIGGYINTVIRADGSTDQAALLLPIVVRWGLVTVFGIAAYQLYRRTIGSRLIVNARQRQATIAEQSPGTYSSKAADGLAGNAQE